VSCLGEERNLHLFYLLFIYFQFYFYIILFFGQKIFKFRTFTENSHSTRGALTYIPNLLYKFKSIYLIFLLQREYFRPTPFKKYDVTKSVVQYSIIFQKQINSHRKILDFAQNYEQEISTFEGRFGQPAKPGPLLYSQHEI